MKASFKQISNTGFSLFEGQETNGTQSRLEVYKIYNISNHPAANSTKGEYSK